MIKMDLILARERDEYLQRTLKPEVYDSLKFRENLPIYDESKADRLRQLHGREWKQ